MSKKSELPAQESKRRQAETQAMYDRAAATRAAEQAAVDAERIRQKNDNHNTL